MGMVYVVMLMIVQTIIIMILMEMEFVVMKMSVHTMLKMI